MNGQLEVSKARESAFQRVLLVQMAVAEMMGVGLMDMHRDTRGDKRAAYARQIAMYLCEQTCGMRQVDVARAFGRDRTTVRHAVRSIEEAREDAEIDRLVGWLEAALRRLESAHV